MARGTSLLRLLDQLRAEVRHSLQPGVGTDVRAMLVHHLQRGQELLYDEYDWPFLRILPFKELRKGQRYYDLPEDLNLERVERVVTYWGNDPTEVCRGIGWEAYAAFDPEKREWNDPVLRWDVRWVPELKAEQIEVWPIPATDTPKLQFQGLRELRPLVDDADVADLDDRLIVLTAAADMLHSARKPGAELKQQLANKRMAMLKARVKQGQHVTHLTGGERRLERGRSVIRIASSAPTNSGG